MLAYLQRKWNPTIKKLKNAGKNKMVLPVRYSLSDRALIGSALATTAAPWRLLTSWLPLISCSSWPHSARDSFTDWKNWFDSRQHHASMRICHYSERNSPSLSGHLNALKIWNVVQKWLILKTFLLNFFEFFLLFFNVETNKCGVKEDIIKDPFLAKKMNWIYFQYFLPIL